MHMAEEHHTRVFSQHSLRAWVEATAVSKEDAAAQARKEQTWNKVQGWLAESNLSSGTSAQHHAGVTHPQVSICTISCISSAQHSLHTALQVLHSIYTFVLTHALILYAVHATTASCQCMQHYSASQGAINHWQVVAVGSAVKTATIRIACSSACSAYISHFVGYRCCISLLCDGRSCALASACCRSSTSCCARTFGQVWYEMSMCETLHVLFDLGQLLLQLPARLAYAGN